MVLPTYLLMAKYGRKYLPPDGYGQIVREAVATTPMRQKLVSSSAIVLERLARGGGATNWYFCRDEQSLMWLEACVQPGSELRVRFDSLVRKLPPNADSLAFIRRVVAAGGETVVGYLCEDGFGIAMESVLGDSELSRLWAEMPRSADLFCGTFPPPETSDMAVTLVLPDADGVVRRHPH